MLTPLERGKGEISGTRQCVYFLALPNFEIKFFILCFWKHSELTRSGNMQLFACCNLKVECVCSFWFTNSDRVWQAWTHCTRPIFWGLIFSTFLDVNATHPDSVTIKYTVILVVIGAFVSRLLIYYLKIPNLRFRKL